MTSWARIEAERAFGTASRARRRTALRCRLWERRCGCARLPVLDEVAAAGGGARGVGMRPIALAAIDATVEPNRAAQFDGAFRPAAAARERWLRIWLAEHRGTVLPPISVVQVGDRFAVRDGHHRVSVAKARGALTIDAFVAAA